MIAEALGTLVTLGWALAAWIVLLALVAAVVLHAMVAVVWWLCRTVRRACRGAWRGRVAPQGVPDGSRVAEPAPVPPQSSTRPSAPTWARTDKETA